MTNVGWLGLGVVGSHGLFRCPGRSLGDGVRYRPAEGATGVQIVDAPVSGGAARARQGDLLIMVSG
jgi:hypothetical protein